MPTPEWYEDNKRPVWQSILIYIGIALFILLMVGKCMRAEQSMRCDQENGNFDNGTWECVK